MKNILKHIWKITTLILFVVIAILYIDFSPEKKEFNNNLKSYQGKKAKYIFYFIGDGLGIQQSNAAEIYMASIQGKIGINKLNLNKLKIQAFFTTYAEDRYITGSAAAGTAMATGYKTTINTISMDATRQKNLKTITEIAKENGMKVGIISCVDIDHATPACFYSHQPSRNNFYEIGIDLANSDFDFFGGGGLRYPAGINNDKKINAYVLAEKNAYRIVDNKAEFEKLDNNSGKIIAISPVLYNSGSTRYIIDQNEEDISLTEFTKKAIEVLDNNKGFFIMIEGGKIDWACHANDAATTIHEVLEFDKAIGEAIEFYKKHKDETLIVVVGDHETGGMTIGFAGTGYESFFHKLQHQKISFYEFNKLIKKYKEENINNPKFSDILELIKIYFGLGDDSLGLGLSKLEISMLKDAFMISMINNNNNNEDKTYLLYGGYEPITVTTTHILNQKAGISWTTYAHTGTPIPIRVHGTGNELFSGYYDNTDIPKKIMKVMGFEF
ncbi:MAG: alkaline phosphatase [Bacteroidales bacterium]|nr:alkaline phosphatase [Bacteroidales bacterium]